MAKLLSRDEQSSTAKHPLLLRTRKLTRVLFTAPASVFLILLLAARVQNPPASNRVVNRDNRLLPLRRALWKTLFVRPPPVLA